MNPPQIAEVVVMLVVVNVAALLLLAVISYVGSVLSLDALEFMDRRLDSSQKARPKWCSVKKITNSCQRRYSHSSDST